MGMLEMVFLVASRPWMFVGICIGLLAWGMFPVVLCEGWFYENVRKEKILRRLVFTALLLFFLRFGGAFLLSLAELSWRRWVKALMTYSLLGMLCFLGAKTVDRLMDNPERPNWIKWLSALWLVALIGSAIGYAGLRLVFSSAADLVTEWEGQTVVLENTGIFEETGYAYAGPFVRGRDALFVWSD